jgi:hypothetical protein
MKLLGFRFALAPRLCQRGPKAFRLLRYLTNVAVQRGAEFELPEFDEYQDESDVERPPLLGSTAPPAGLRDVDWAALDDAYGTADETPLFVEALTSDDDGDRNFGVYGLCSATTHQGGGRAVRRGRQGIRARRPRRGGRVGSAR